MVESTGQIKGDKLWHVYRYPQKPKTLMVLGSILTKPDNLESTLNYRQMKMSPFPKDKTLDQTEAARRFMRSEISKSSGGRLKALLPFSPMASAGGGLSANISNSLENTIEGSHVRAVAIMPDEAADFVNEALQLPRVIEHVKKGSFGEPLFMIVGVATCRRMCLGSSSSKGRSGSLDLDASLTVAGVEAGAGISRDKTSSGGFEVEIDEECDFAYRVREFQYSRWKKRIKKSRDVTEGAMFGGSQDDDDNSNNNDDDNSNNNDDDDSRVEEVPVFEYFESEDEDLS